MWCGLQGMGTAPKRSQGGHWSGPGPPCRCTVWRQMHVYIYICVCILIYIYCNRVVLVTLSGDLFSALWPPRDVFREQPVLLWDFLWLLHAQCVVWTGCAGGIPALPLLPAALSSHRPPSKAAALRVHRRARGNTTKCAFIA